MSIKVYNVLSRKEEEFKPLKKGEVKIYSCGPTVYNYAHIGNFRTFLFNDLLKRAFLYLGYKVKHVMNITDVDDKTIKGSVKEKSSLSSFTQKYEKLFFEDLDSLNIEKPEITPRATDNIKQMVDLIDKLLKKGYAYKAEDGIYFSIDKFKGYGKLAGLDKVKSKERIKNDEYDKSNPQDFALWKFYTEEDGKVFWETKIGKGRPGWHIECSAMSMRYLGETFDIHTGGVDLCFPHHTNEIAQSEAATGKQFVKYWMHGAHLTMKEGKMSKSLGNVFTLKELEEKGFSPLDYRYLCLMTHYRKSLDFSLENLESAKTAYSRLKRKVLSIEGKAEDKTEEYDSKFREALEDDLNIPLALQIFIKAVDDSDFDAKKKFFLLAKFNSVLGLNFEEEENEDVPEDVSELVKEREEARKNKDWKESDRLRDEIASKGYKVEDGSDGSVVTKI